MGRSFQKATSSTSTGLPKKAVAFHGRLRQKSDKMGRYELDDMRMTLKDLKSNQRGLMMEDVLATLTSSCETLLESHESVVIDLDSLREENTYLREEKERLQISLDSSQRLLSLFEKLNYVMDLMDINELERSTVEIENTTRRYDAVFDIELPPRDVSTKSNPTGEKEKVFMLVQRRFKALENLVFVLKKRILTLENNEDLAESLKAFGSIRNLLDDNSRLKRENEKLRVRELCYANEPLLRRRNLGRYDSTQLQMLILALQNELGNALAIINEQNLADHPTRRRTAAKAGFTPVEAIEELDIDELFSYAGKKPSDGDAAMYIKELDGSIIQTLQSENATLKEVIARLEKDRDLRRSLEDLCREFRDMEESDDSAQLVKEKKLAKLAILTKEQAGAIEAATTAYKQKCSEFKTVEELLKGMQLSRAKLMDDNIRISNWCTSLQTEKERAREAIKAHQKRVDSVTSLGKALALSMLIDENKHLYESDPDNPTPEDVDLFIGRLYRDYFAAYAAATGASTKIQAMLKGRSVRRRSSGAGHIGKSNPKSPSRDPDAPQDGAKDIEAGPKLLPHLTPLVEVILRSTTDLQNVTSIQHSVELAKFEVARALRADVAGQLESMKRDIAETSRKIHETVFEMTKKPQNHVAVQVKAKMRHGAVQYQLDEEEVPAAKGKKK